MQPNLWRVKHQPYERVRALGLDTHLMELETYGVTVLPPETIGIARHLSRLRAAILRVAHTRTGIVHDIETGAHGRLDVMGANDAQYILFALLAEDRVFEEVACCEHTLALIDYYLGAQCRLSSIASFVKWANPVGYGEHLGLHCDGADHPAPLPLRPHVVNTNWILTDYTRANGAFCVVPGSHRYCRMPVPGEGVNDAIPVEAPAGSVIVFHGNVWHGAFPKSTDGLRLSVNAFYCAPPYRTQETFRHLVDPAMLERNPPRLRSLVGYDDPWGFDDARGPVPYHQRVTDRANGEAS